MKTINFNIVSDIYDYYVNTDLDIPFFMKETEKAAGEILELMCGTGRVSIPLLREGRNMTCVDYCEDMLFRFKEKATDENLYVDIIEQDVTELNLNKKFDIALIPFHSFGEIADKEKQRILVQKVCGHLFDGGKFICTLQNPALRGKSADGSLRFINPVKMDDGQTLLVSYINNYNPESGIVSGAQFYEIYDSSNQLVEKRFLEIKFRLIPKAEFEEMISQNGFVLDRIYGNYDFSEFDESTSPYMLYILTKKQS